MSDNHQKEGMFEITTASSFFKKVKKDYHYFSDNIANSCAAMNCIISLYHLYEWVWYKWLEGNISAQKEFKIEGKKGLEGCKQFEKYLNNINKQRLHFDLLRKLANGTKHCRLTRETHPNTEHISGYGKGPYGIGPYGKDYLLIDLGEDVKNENRYLSVNKILHEIMDFWEKFFTDHNICDPENGT